MQSQDTLLLKLNSSDIIRLLEYLGVEEKSLKYGNDCLIIPTICHNELIAHSSHKLYYYEGSKRFYCYTNCKGMSVYDFIMNTYRARGFKIDFTQARTLLSNIINERIKTGFAIIQAPKTQTKNTAANWPEQLTIYNPHVLECFTQQPKYLAPWIKEGIDYNILVDYNVRFDLVRNRIVFPVYDHLGRLVGIKVRNFNKTDLEEHRKYMPLWHNKELYNYPKMMVLFGFYQNKSIIKKSKEVILYEAEKSVLMHGSYFTQNKSVAMGGSSFSDYHSLILKNIGVEKIVLAMDNDWSETGDRYYGLKKALDEALKIKDMGFNVEIIYDWEQSFLDNKDSPVDKGRQIYSKLYRDRKSIEETQIFLDQKETNNGISDKD